MGVNGPFAGEEGPEEPDPEPVDPMELEGEMMGYAGSKDVGFWWCMLSFEPEKENWRSGATLWCVLTAGAFHILRRNSDD